MCVCVCAHVTPLPCALHMRLRHWPIAIIHDGRLFFARLLRWSESASWANATKEILGQHPARASRMLACLHVYETFFGKQAQLTRVGRRLANAFKGCFGRFSNLQLFVGLGGANLNIQSGR